MPLSAELGGRHREETREDREGNEKDWWSFASTKFKTFGEIERDTNAKNPRSSRLTVSAGG